MAITIQHTGLYKDSELELESYGITEDSIPFGNNSLSTVSAFVAKKLYQVKIDDIKMPQMFDKKYYGTVEPISQIPMMVNEKYLLSVSSLKSTPNKPSSSDVRVMDFVALAYDDLRKYIVKNIVYNDVDLQITPWKFNDVPAAGFISHFGGYQDYLGALYNAFIKTYSEVLNKVETVEQFSEALFRYLETILQNLPFTRSGFIRSRYHNPLCSGLVLDVANGNKTSDKEKYTKYIQSDLFKLIRQSCFNYGFKIDENIPWRLIADVGSTSMKIYMEKVGILAEEDIWEERYMPGYHLEIYNFVDKKVFKALSLLEIVEKWWQTFAASPGFKTNFRHLPPDACIMPLEGLAKKADPWCWLRIYGWLRWREEKRSGKQEDFERAIKEAIGRAVTIPNGYINAIQYLNHSAIFGPKEDSKTRATYKLS